jgi:hypothetical protein
MVRRFGNVWSVMFWRREGESWRHQHSIRFVLQCSLVHLKSGRKTLETNEFPHAMPSFRTYGFLFSSNTGGGHEFLIDFPAITI